MTRHILAWCFTFLPLLFGWMSVSICSQVLDFVFLYKSLNHVFHGPSQKNAWLDLALVSDGVIAISCPDLDSVLALASKNILELFVLFLLKLIVQCPFTIFIFSCQDDHY